MATPLPPQKEGVAPKFSVHVYCGQTAGWIKMALDTELDLSPWDFALHGDPAHLPKRGLCVRWGPSPLSYKKGAKPPPRFSAHFHCGQTAGWIRIALDMEVGLDPGHIVLDGDRAPLPKKWTEPPPHF